MVGDREVVGLVFRKLLESQLEERSWMVSKNERKSNA